MTTGTKIIESALASIGAHSVVKPANAESVQWGMDKLNSMNAGWQDIGIDMGTVPLKVPGDDLSEPLGARNAIIANLAVVLQPDFPGTVISTELRANALKGLSQIKRTWQVIEIPKAQTRGTLPVGQGNKPGIFGDTYFNEGDELG